MLVEKEDFCNGVNIETKFLQLMAERSPIQVDPIKMVFSRFFALKVVNLAPAFTMLYLNHELGKTNTEINCSSECYLTFFIMEHAFFQISWD